MRQLIFALLTLSSACGGDSRSGATSDAPEPYCEPTAEYAGCGDGWIAVCGDDRPVCLPDGTVGIDSGDRPTAFVACLSSGELVCEAVTADDPHVRDADPFRCVPAPGCAPDGG